MRASSESRLPAAASNGRTCRRKTSSTSWKSFSESNSIPAKQIEPLHEINSPEIFIYEADNLRDSFSNDLEILETLNKDEVPLVVGEGPDLNRRKEILRIFNFSDRDPVDEDVHKFSGKAL